MAAKKNNEKLIDFRKHTFHLNIGILVFAIILFYTLYFAVQYFTTDHIMAYEVTDGSIVSNTTFTGIALREEEVFYAQSSGTLDYYVNEGDRVASGSLIYSIDHSGIMRDYLTEHEGELTSISKDDLSDYQKLLQDYTISYSNTDYQTLYELKKQLNKQLTGNRNRKALDVLTASGDAVLSNDLSLYYSSQPGIVVYSSDGYESLTTDSINNYSFEEATYMNNESLDGREIESGRVCYKLITSEDWSVVIPVDSEMARTLEEAGAVEVEFLKDGSRSYATIEMIYKENGTFANLKFSNSMVRFCTDRFVELRLLTDSIQGLKIPNSSIASRDFFLVPKEFLTKSGNSSDRGFMMETLDENGEMTLKYMECDIYDEDDDYLYISTDSFAVGDVIRKADSTERFILSKTASLLGVYNINKGYAIFKEIDILYQNEEYAIISADTEYGLAQFDYIAIDAEGIYEGEIVK